jgi:hypothetical protein
LPESAIRTRAAGGLDRVAFVQPVDEALRYLACRRGDGVLLDRRGHSAREYVAFVVRVGGKVVERGANGESEVPGEDVRRRVGEPVCQEEGLVLGEVAVVEDEQELTTGIETLDRVGDARREVPQVATEHVRDEVPAGGVDGGDARRPGDHVGPLGLLVPVHLADSAGLEAHVDPRELGRHGELARCHLAGPAAGEHAVARLRVRELQVGDRACVGVR